MMESSNYEIAHDLWNSFRDAVMFSRPSVGRKYVVPETGGHIGYHSITN